MNTAVDSSVLFCIRNKEADFKKWERALMRASREGMLLICPEAFAEVSTGYADARTALEALEALNIAFDETSPEAAFLAGKIHLAYRRAGGLRDHLLPDFLIAAHAEVQAGRLAAIDRGYLWRYFPKLPLLPPE